MGGDPISTIKDVAKHAKTSIATVSRFLNGEKIRERNKINIERAIKELDYTVHSFARSLKTNKSYTIGFILPRLSNVFFSTIADAAQRYLIPYGYSLVVVSLDYKTEKLPEAIRFLMSKKVDGIMISMTFCIEEHFIRGFNVKGIPIVFIDSLFDGMLSDAVVTDNVGGVYEGVKHLINKGHERIGIINGPQTFLTARERYTGYIKALRDHNLKIDENIIKFGDYDVKSGYNVMKELLDQGDIPTAVLSANYRMTIGALEAINEKKLVIPHDLSFVTFDDMEISKIYTTKLTSIRQPLTEIGETASKIILDRIENGYTLSPPEITRLKTKLVERDSVRNNKLL